MSQPLPIARPPPHFYRVQHTNSRTIQHPNNALESRGHHREEYRQWLTTKTIQPHLDWGHRSDSPFISVFDNEDDADTRAKFHRDIRSHEGVRVVKISSASLEPRIITLNPGSYPRRFLVWEGPKGVMFFSTLDARRYLRLEGISSSKEWFALDFITGDMVVDVRYLSTRSFEVVRLMGVRVMGFEL